MSMDLAINFFNMILNAKINQTFLCIERYYQRSEKSTEKIFATLGLNTIQQKKYSLIYKCINIELVYREKTCDIITYLENQNYKRCYFITTGMNTFFKKRK